jgi:chemotaxis protein methyltransferase CheR
MADGTHSAEKVDAIRLWVAEHLGITFDPEQSHMFARRLARQFGEHDRSLEETWLRIQSGDTRTIQRLAEAASTNHTFFHREQESFDRLRDVVFPKLPGTGPLRFWSAASSSGEEAFTLAMVCADDDDVRDRARILGTDISEHLVRVAERGIYARSALDSVPEIHRRHFVAYGDEQIAVHKTIRTPCTFRRMNLARLPWPFRERFHVIFLRNVLYYFAHELKQAVLSACYEVAAPGGFLVLSLSESMLDVSTSWKQVAPGIFHKARGR